MNSRRISISSCDLRKIRCAGILALLLILAISAKPSAAQGFQVPPTYAVGASPSSIAVGDLNGDGFPDMVVTNSGGTTVSVLINAGNGTFLPAVNYSTLFAPSSVAIADLNGDGKPDLIVGTSSGVSILINSGTGTFPAAFGYSTATGQVVVGDFNGDGKLDIATSGGSILLGLGNGNFQPGTSFSPIGVSIAAGDFNGDGKTDLALAEGGCTGSIDIFLGSASGALTLAHSYSFAGDVSCPTGTLALGDLNGDGRLDIALAISGGGIAEDPGTGIEILLGNSDGSFTTQTLPQFAQFSSGTTSVLVADFNSDGKKDVAIASMNTGIILYLGNGDGTVQAPAIWGSPTSIEAAGDVNKDGHSDLVEMTTTGVGILFGNGDGTFQAQSSYFVGYPSADVNSIATGDFNGDGALDLFAASFVEFEGDPLTVTLLGNGKGGFQSSAPQYAGPFATCGTAVADVNGDGKQDEIISMCSAGIGIYEGNGDGTFQSQTSASGDESDAIAAGDLNGDGKVDLISTNGGNLEVLLGNGDGTFQLPSSYPCGSFCSTLRLGDLNGDGIGDVVAGDVDGNKLVVFIGNGNGTFKPGVPYALASSPRSITAGDFNSDGKPDLAVATQAGVYLLLAISSGTFQTPVLIAAASSSVAAVDVNGDGKLDIVSASSLSTGGLVVLYGNGNGTFQPPIAYGGNSFFGVVRAGDFNGDGAPDIAAGTSLQNFFTVFMNSGGTYVTTTSSTSSLYFDAPVTFTTTVAPGIAESSTPTGTVSFFDGATLLGSAPVVSGEAILTISNLTVGTHTILATYSGDTHFNPHSASPITQRVQQAPTSTSFVYSYGSGPGDPITFTITVTSLTAGIPTGTASMGGNTKINGTAPLNASGQATLTFSYIAAGRFYLGASYSGDSNYQPSSTALGRFDVPRYSSTTVLISSANPVTAGQSVTFTATVSSDFGPPANGETVTFKNGGLTLGISTISGGIATLTTSSLPPGSNMIKAVYGGDTNIFSSTSAILTETVNNYSSTTTLASNVNPSMFGQNVTFTTTVSAVSGGAPGGTVTFKNGTAVLGTQNLTSGVATLSTNVLTVGTHSITAVYSGDATHGGSTSSTLSQVVNKATTTASITSSKNPSTFGQSVTFTVTITPSGSGTPTGSVSFKSGTKSLGGVQLASGVATLTTTTLAAGSDTITATYSGSANFLTSSATLTQVVN